ncbi:MAG TPA: hypothetical protein VF042_14945 [Gemmatimonadaceae bacterium]
MFKLMPICAAALGLAAAGCSDTQSPTDNLRPSAARGTAGRAVANLNLMDACDPETFSVVPGGCARNGGITLEQFNAQLARLGVAPAWQISPPDVYLHEGDAFMATNIGGEMHTFTEVEEFGGGIVPALNAASGNTEVAPECTTLGQSDFLAPGQSTDAEETDEVEDEHYQCCIHPWMRTTIHVRGR